MADDKKKRITSSSSSESESSTKGSPEKSKSSSAEAIQEPVGEPSSEPPSLSHKVTIRKKTGRATKKALTTAKGSDTPVIGDSVDDAVVLISDGSSKSTSPIRSPQVEGGTLPTAESNEASSKQAVGVDTEVKVGVPTSTEVDEQSKNPLSAKTVKNKKNGSLKSSDKLEVKTHLSDSATKLSAKENVEATVADNVEATVADKSKKRELADIVEAAADAEENEGASHDKEGASHDKAGRSDSTDAPMETASTSREDVSSLEITAAATLLYLSSKKQKTERHVKMPVAGKEISSSKNATSKKKSLATARKVSDQSSESDSDTSQAEVDTSKDKSVLTKMKSRGTESQTTAASKKGTVRQSSDKTKASSKIKSATEVLNAMSKCAIRDLPVRDRGKRVVKKTDDSSSDEANEDQQGAFEKETSDAAAGTSTVEVETAAEESTKGKKCVVSTSSGRGKSKKIVSKAGPSAKRAGSAKVKPTMAEDTAGEANKAGATLNEEHSCSQTESKAVATGGVSNPPPETYRKSKTSRANKKSALTDAASSSVRQTTEYSETNRDGSDEPAASGSTTLSKETTQPEGAGATASGTSVATSCPASRPASPTTDTKEKSVLRLSEEQQKELESLKKRLREKDCDLPDGKKETNEEWLIPFVFGWKREIRSRKTTQTHSCDIYYHPPDQQSVSLDSLKEVQNHISKNKGTVRLGNAYFCYKKVPIIGLMEPYEYSSEVKPRKEKKGGEK